MVYYSQPKDCGPGTSWRRTLGLLHPADTGVTPLGYQVQQWYIIRHPRIDCAPGTYWRRTLGLLHPADTWVTPLGIQVQQWYIIRHPRIVLLERLGAVP